MVIHIKIQNMSDQPTYFRQNIQMDTSSSSDEDEDEHEKVHMEELEKVVVKEEDLVPTFPPPSLPPQCVVRKACLQNVWNTFENGTGICILSGIGGCGKTVVAQQFIELYQKEFDNIYWLNGSNFSDALENLKNVAVGRFRIPLGAKDGDDNNEVKDSETLVHEMYGAILESNVNTLFVFDDVEGAEDSPGGTEGILALLPSFSVEFPSCLKILVTSCNSQWKLPFSEIVSVDTFNQDEALMFLQKMLPITDIHPRDASILAEIFGGCPVLLRELAENFVAEADDEDDGKTSEDVLEFAQGRFVNQILPGTLDQEDDVIMPNTICSVWVTTLLEVACAEGGELSLKLLKFISFFPTDTLRKQLLFALSTSDEENFDMALALLEKYCFISVDSVNKVIRTNPGLQLVLRHRPIDFDPTTIRDFIRAIVVFLSDEANELQDDVVGLVKDLTSKLVNKYYKTLRKTVVNFIYYTGIRFAGFHRYEDALHCFDVVEEMLEEDDIQADEDFGQDFKLQVEFSVASVKERQCKFPEALTLHTHVLEHRVELLGQENHGTINSMDAVAGLLYDLGRYEESCEKYEHLVEARTLTLGRDHPHTISALYNKGNCLRHLGKARESVKILEQVVEYRNEVPGGTHPQTLSTIHSYGKALHVNGEYDKAEEVLKDVEERMSETLGPVHEVTLSVQNSIANVLKDQGKLTQALKSHKKIAEIRVATLGEDHPETLRALNNVATGLRRNGDLDEALEILHRVAASMEQVLGPVHPHTLSAMSNIANILLSQGKLQEAIDLHREIQKKRSTNLYVDSPDTITSSYNIAIVLQAQGKVIDAWKLLKEVEARRLEILGPDHPDTLTTQQYLAFLIERLLAQEAAFDIEPESDTVVDDHSKALRKLRLIAEKEEQSDDLEKALAAVTALANERKGTVGVSHRDTLDAFYRRAMILKKLGRYDEALVGFNEVLEKRKRTLGAHHEVTLRTMYEVAEAKNCLQDLAGSLDTHFDVLRRRKKFFGDSHIETCESKTSCALLLQKVGRNRESLVLHKEVAKEIESLLGPHDLRTLDARSAVDALTKKLSLLCDTDEMIPRSGSINSETNESKDTLLTAETRTIWKSLATRGQLLYSQGNFNEAHDIYQDLVLDKQKYLGSTHAETLAARNTVAGVLLAMGKLSEAYPRAKSASELLLIELGPSHPETLAAFTNLGLILMAQGKPATAAPYLTQVVDNYKKLYGNDHPKTLNALTNRAICLKKSGDYDEVLNTHLLSAQKRKQKLGSNHPDTLSSLNNAANAYRLQGNLKKALSIHMEVIQKRSKILGPNHPDTLSSRSNMANVLAAQGSHDAALMIHQEVLEKRGEVLGKMHPDTLSTSYNIAMVYKMQGHEQKALESFKKLWEDRKVALGPTHGDTIVCRELVQSLLETQLNDPPIKQPTEDSPFAFDNMLQ